MLVIEDKFKNVLKTKTYVCLGSFDGLHLGHMKLIYKTIENAKKNNCKSMVYTFSNHPLSIINRDKSPQLIMDNQTKIKILKKIGIDIVNLVPFDEMFMNIEPVKFIHLLIKYYNVQGIIVGFNYKFGHNNKGNVTLLKELSKKYKFKLDVINPVKIDKEIVSSTKIRTLLKAGLIERANNMLFKNFSLEGKVIEGKKLGNKIGFPTINLDVDRKFLIPKNGIYYTLTAYDKKLYKSMTNIGFCPTVDGKNFTIETHILDFNKNIYGQKVKIIFIKRMRDEIKFSSIEGLIYQLNKDREFIQNENLNLFNKKNNLQFYIDLL